MKVWYKPPVYVVIHILSGVIGYFFPVVLLIMVLYHFLQYFLEVRFFIFDLNYKTGNSIEHTCVKLFEVLIGYLLAFAVMYVRKHN